MVRDCQDQRRLSGCGIEDGALYTLGGGDVDGMSVTFRVGEMTVDITFGVMDLRQLDPGATLRVSPQVSLCQPLLNIAAGERRGRHTWRDPHCAFSLEYVRHHTSCWRQIRRNHQGYYILICRIPLLSSSNRLPLSVWSRE